MRHPVLFIAFALAASSVTAQVPNYRKEADKYNQRSQGIVYQMESHVASDSVRYYRNVMDVVDYSLKCDENDRKPNRKGVVKTKYENENRNRLTYYRPLLIDAGLFFMKNHYPLDGIDSWKLYLKTSQNPLLSTVADEDESALAAFYIAQYKLEQHDYEQADQFATMALADESTAQSAAEIKAECMHARMVNEEDSLRYLAVLEKLYNSDPSNDTYFAWLMRFYKRQSSRFNLENFVDKQLMDNPDSPVPWILKGEIAMHAKRWHEAVDAYQHADEYDPTRIPVIYNIGVCLVNEAVDIYQGNDTESVYGGETIANRDDEDKMERVNNLYAQARNYLERVREKDPHRKTVDWVKTLYNIYVILGDKIKAEELEPVVNKFK